MIDLSRAEWRKAAASTGSNGGCVEVADNLPQVTALRDSTRPDGGAHVIAKNIFAAFLDDLKNGQYDL